MMVLFEGFVRGMHLAAFLEFFVCRAPSRKEFSLSQVLFMIIIPSENCDSTELIKGFFHVGHDYLSSLPNRVS